MIDRNKRKEQLISEMKALQEQIDELTSLETKKGKTKGIIYKDKAEEYLDIAGVIIVVIDSSQRISLLNKKGCELLGCNREDIIGKNWFDNFIPERDRGQVKDVFVQLMDGDLEPVEFYENVVLTKQGKERTISWHNTVLTDENNTIIGTLSSGEDVTEKRRVENKLRESEKKFKSLHSAMTEGFPICRV